MVSRSRLWLYKTESALIKENFRTPCRKSWVIFQKGEIGKGINMRTDNKHFYYRLRIGNDWKVMTVDILIWHNTKICKCDLWMSQEGLSRRYEVNVWPFLLPPLYSGLPHLKQLESNWNKSKRAIWKDYNSKREESLHLFTIANCKGAC